MLACTDTLAVQAPNTELLAAARALAVLKATTLTGQKAGLAPATGKAEQRKQLWRGSDEEAVSSSLMWSLESTSVDWPNSRLVGLRCRSKIAAEVAN